MISIKGLHKYFNKGKQNEIHVINDVTIDLPERGMTAIYGKSGCGKTTLLNVIGGLDGFAQGSVTIEGQSISAKTDEIRNKYVGYIFQNYNLSNNESCFDNVAAALRLCGMTDRDEIEKRVRVALRNVGMEKYFARTPDTLSGGQQQRIAIARAIVKNPPIILADEPTGNLDEANTLMIMDLLREIAKDHLVLLVTHEENLVHAYCDSIIELSDGKIVSVTQGRAEGVFSKSKQDIYLGELTKQSHEDGLISLDYYGDSPETPIAIKIVNKDGRFYLKLDDKRVNILEDTGEIRLIDGVFKKEERQAPAFDMTALPEVKGERFGRLFSIRSSLISAYSEISKWKTRSKKTLRRVLMLFAAVAVLTSSIFGSAIGNIMDAEDSYNHNTFYLYTADGTDSDLIETAFNDKSSGIDSFSIYPYYPSGDSYLSFRLASFETFSDSYYAGGVSTHGSILDGSVAEGLPLLAGNRDFPAPEYILISDKVADDIIETSGFGYVDEYSDIIGMTCTAFSVNGKNLRVGGVVRSGEHAIYLSSMTLARYSLYMSYSTKIAPASDYGISLNDGEAVSAVTTPDVENMPAVGSVIKVNGKDLIIKDSISPYTTYFYWLDGKGINIESREEYFASRLPEGDTLEGYIDTHYFEYDEYYYSYLDDYLHECQMFDVAGIDNWLYLNKGIKEVRGLYLSTDLNKAESFKKINGRYPTKTEYDQLESTLPGFDSEILLNYYAMYEEEYYSQVNNTLSQNTCLVSDADYVKLARRIGETHSAFASDYNYFIYTLIHSSDPDLTEAFLTEHFGDREIEYYDSIITPTMIKEGLISYESDTVTGYIISLIVSIIIMSVCMYFIMRSSLMSRVKEIGIYRAIGVSRGNIILRFATEAALLASLTIFVGYALSSLFIALCEYISPAASEIFFYPIWYGALVLIILMSMTLICGVLPVMLLLRRTPSEILAKYDV